MSSKIEKLRERINIIDRKIVKLLDSRVALAEKIGKIKMQKGIKEIFALNREREIIKGVKMQKRKVLSDKAVESIYREIISACRSAERMQRIGFLGPEGTFCHEASYKIFGSSSTFIPYSDIEEIFGKVENREIDYGVVPIENSVEGSVNTTLDLLFLSNVCITGEKKCNISHNLLAKKGVKLKDIKVIYSHPQAFAQCRGFLDKNLPLCERREVSSTARGCKLLDNKSASIGSKLAAKIYGLNVLKENIHDAPDNSTRFIIISLSDTKSTGNDKTSIIFSVPDKPGALYNILRIFADRNINLTKIESRPSKQKSWEYIFFVDFQGHREERECKEALEIIKNNSTFLKILGSYPVC